MHALIYTRVSSDQQELDGTSLDTQQRACLAYCEEHGYAVAGVYSDTYTGAQYRERPGLTALRQVLASVSSGPDVVLCYALDRLSRNQAHVAILVEEIIDAGARLELVTEEFEDSAVGRFILSAKAFVAEVEREKIAERTNRGRRARAEQGKYIPGPKPKYGYLWRDDNTALAVNAAEAPIVRRIYREFNAGASLRAIARGLMDDNVPSPTGRPTWGPSTVRLILHDPAYAGEALAFRWQGHPLQRRNGSGPKTRMLPDAPDPIQLPDGVVPALVSAAQGRAARRRLAANVREATRNNPRPQDSLLRAGFIGCVVCGRNLVVNNQSNQYVCVGGGHRMGIKRSALDADVWERVRWFIEQPRVLSSLLAESTTDDDGDLVAVTQQLAGLDRQRANLARTLGQTDDPDTTTILVAQLEQLSQRWRDLEAERAELTTRQADTAQRRAALDSLDTWRASVAAQLDSMDWQQRRDLLRALQLRVNIWPAGQRTPRWQITSALFPRELIPLVFTSSTSSARPSPGRAAAAPRRRSRSR